MADTTLDLDESIRTRLNYDIVLGGELSKKVSLNSVVTIEAALRALLSPNHATRVQGEQTLQPYTDTYIELAFVACHSFFPDDIRTLATVLLKNSIARNAPQHDDAIILQRALIETASRQTTRQNLRQVFHLMALLQGYMERDVWPEVLPFVLRMGKQTVDNKRAVAAMSSLSEFPHEDERELIGVLDVVKAQLESKFEDVQTEAISLFAEMSGFSSTTRKKKTFILEHMPKVLEILQNFQKNRQEHHVRDGWKSLSLLAENALYALFPHISVILDLFMSVMKSEEYDLETKKEALRLFLDLVEEFPQKIEQHPQLLETTLPLILSWQTCVDDWGIEVDEDEEDEDYEFLSECIDRLSLNFGGDRICPILLSLLPSLFASQDWRSRRAALLAISTIGEGSHDYLEGILGQLLDQIGPFAEDVHPQVRWATANTLGQMSTDFQPLIQEKHAPQVLTPLLKTLDKIDTSSQITTPQDLRVYRHFASAIINLFETNTRVPQECFNPALKTHLRLLSSPNTHIKLKEMLYVSLAAIYSCHPDFVPSDFSRFKPYVIGPLFSKESSLSTKVYAAECLGHVAARSDIFESEEELEKVVEVFFKIGEEIAGKRADDKEYDYHESLSGGWLAMACGDILSGERGKKYFPMLFDYLARNAQSTVAVDVFPADDEDEDGNIIHVKSIEERERFENRLAQGWEHITAGNTQIVYDALQVKKKGNSNKCLTLLTGVCPDGFEEYAETAIQIFQKNLTFEYEESVKTMAAEGISNVMEHWANKGEKGSEMAYKSWCSLAPTLIKAIDNSIGNDDDSIKVLVECFTTCMKFIPSSKKYNLQTLQNIMPIMRAAWDSVVEMMKEAMEDGDEGTGKRTRIQEAMEAIWKWSREMLKVFRAYFNSSFDSNLMQIFARLFMQLIPMVPTNMLKGLILVGKSALKGDWLEKDPKTRALIFAPIGILLSREKLTSDLDFFAEQLLACFSSDQTITETEVGKFFITFFQDCDTDIVVKLGFEQFKLYLNLLASILLHPPSDFPEIKQIMKKIVQNAKKEEDFQKAVDFLPLLKRTAIMDIAKE